MEVDGWCVLYFSYVNGVARVCQVNSSRINGLREIIV